MKKGKILYKGRILSVERIEVMHNGKRFLRDKIVGPRVALVMPFLDRDTIVMERQYRFAINKTIYELPAGHIEKGETPKDAAARELEEETGYRAGRLEPLFIEYPIPGAGSEKQFVYAAYNLKKTKASPDPAERIEVKLVKLNRLLQMIRKNEIQDLKTIATVLYYLQKNRKWRL